jgi:hypothetical protein
MKMMLIDLPCGNCKHIRPKKDGWIPVCDAFPERIPRENLYYKNIEELKLCNNNIGYEPKDKAL